MRTQRETYLEKCMNLLELLKLTQKQLADLEEYLSGTKDAEVLESLSYQNLGVSPKSYPPALTNLISYGYDNAEQTGRLFNILFAIGGTSCHCLVPNTHSPEVFGHLLKLPQVDPAKIIAVAAEQMAANSYFFKGATLRWFIDQLNGDPERIRSAYLVSSYPLTEKNVLYSLMHSYGAGQVFLLTTYFLAKYPDGKGPLSEDDLPIMKYFEDTLTDNLTSIYDTGTIPISVIQELNQAIRRNQVTDRILKLAGKNYRTSMYFLNLFGGAALLNYGLSDILRNFVKICFAANLQGMFTNAVLVSESFPMDTKTAGGDYDTIFDIDSKALILQAASRELEVLMKTQFHKNRDLFLEVLEKANAHDSFAMMGVLKQEDEMLFFKRQKQGGGSEREKLIDIIADKNPVIKEVKNYLRGDTGISSLYPIENQIFVQYGYNAKLMQARTLLHSYVDTYHDPDFYSRVLSYQLLRGTSSFFYNELHYYLNLSIRQMFASFDAEHVDIGHQLKFIPLMYQYFYSEKDKNQLIDSAAEVFSGYLSKNREEVLTAFKESDVTVRMLAVKVLSKNPGDNKTELLNYTKDSSKLVKEVLLTALYQQKNWEPDILELLSSKKAGERDIAIHVLAKWDLEKYRPKLTEAIEKEKNTKIKTLLQELLDEDSISAGNVLTLQDLVKDLLKGGKKRTLAWAYETPFSPVHKKASCSSSVTDKAEDGQPDGGIDQKQKGSEPILAEEEYLQAILLCYSTMPKCGVNKDAQALAAELNEEELAAYVNELFDKWLTLGAEAKKRWVLFAASIHGGTDIIKKLQHHINDWPQHSRGAIAADAVQALALNPKPEALLIVDSISRKFKFRQVKNAAGEALKFAAEQLGITTEELADRIVPDLGFDENMERQFDYGERKFTVTITPALEVEVFDESGKKLKNLPAPGKKDDPEKSAESYAAFKEMKKQMKTTVSSQKMRLELALSTERKWTCEAWKKLFVENPIMHQFAIGLIWGIYEENKLTQTFRYMEDGSFSTEDEEEFMLPDDEKGADSKTKIGLVHPVELSGESIEAWKTQLEDYEITQPIEQLSRPVYHMTDEEADEQIMERFGGYMLNDLSLQGKMQNMGWYRGQAEDAGIFYYYYREDKDQGLRAELNFSGSYVGGENEDVTVFDVKFNKKIGDLPERYFSEIVMQTAKAIASSKEKDPAWREKK